MSDQGLSDNGPGAGNAEGIVGDHVIFGGVNRVIICDGDGFVPDAVVGRTKVAKMLGE